MERSPFVDPGIDSTGRQLPLRVSFWLLGYGTIVAAWSIQNAMPFEMFAAVGFLPVSLALSARFYRRNRFAFKVWQDISEWEMLISLLVLATGIASGLVMLMSLGWVSIGIVALRPAQPDPEWAEWYKLPVLFLFCMPVWMDLGGNRHDWLQFLTGHTNTSPGMVERAVELFRMQVTMRVCLVLVLISATGAVFWCLLPLIPVALLCGSLCEGWFQGQPGWFAHLFGAGIALGILGLLGNLLARIRHHLPLIRQGWQMMIRRVFGRFPAPWLAGIVILFQQSSLVEGWLASIQPHFNLAGGVILLLALLGVRRSCKPGPMHLNSRLFLAAALFVLLAAEWTDLNPLRHLSLGLLVISASFWGCALGWTGYFFALGAWVTLIPATQVLAVRAGIPPSAAAAGAWVGFAFFLGGFLAFTMFPRKELMARLHPDTDWQPVKRFSFILTALLVGFQIISAFRPRGDRFEGRIAFGASMAVSTWPLAGALSDGERVRNWTLAWENQRVDLAILTPPEVPVRLYAPELVFTSAGWQIERRRLVPHANGQMVELVLKKGQRRACALFWFQNNDRAFVDYLRARHILWSGWNLSRRDVRLVVAFSDQVLRPEQLEELAEADGWFTRELGLSAAEVEK